VEASALSNVCKNASKSLQSDGCSFPITFAVFRVLFEKCLLFQVIEDDPETGCFFVGRGGLPNSKGVLECDAAVMVGDKCRFGAVAALQG